MPVLKYKYKLIRLQSFTLDLHFIWNLQYCYNGLKENGFCIVQKPFFIFPGILLLITMGKVPVMIHLLFLTEFLYFFKGKLSPKQIQCRTDSHMNLTLSDFF